jgi:hypothetical protein
VLVFKLFDIRVVPHFFSPFAEGSNQFQRVDLVGVSALELQMVCKGKDKKYSLSLLILIGNYL